MTVETSELISAARIAPDDGQFYRVAVFGDHKTLKVGDVVVMRQTPRNDNVFVRLSDLSVHSISDKLDGYVWVVRMNPAGAR